MRKSLLRKGTFPKLFDYSDDQRKVFYVTKLANSGACV